MEEEKLNFKILLLGNKCLLQQHQDFRQWWSLYIVTNISGAGESGKSTVVKQIKLIWKAGGGLSLREKVTEKLILIILLLL
jgi:hypothetical protein